VFYGRRARWTRSVSTFAKVNLFGKVGLNGGRQDDTVQRYFGAAAYQGTIRFGGRDLNGMTGAPVARAGIVPMPREPASSSVT